MRKFLASYEQLRNCEKSLISEGYNPNHFKHTRKNYGQLIKIFAERSEAADFRRRTSLFDKPEDLRPSSPVIANKRVKMKNQEA